MSGGITGVRLDRVNDFLSLRKEAFGIKSAPLPRSLALPAAESLVNEVMNPRVRVTRARVADSVHEEQSGSRLVVPKT